MTMSDHDDLTARLRRLGEEPVDPWLATRHLTAMAAARPARGAQWRGRMKIAAAFAAGLLLGGTGLAAADVLPNPVQGVAHDTLAKVGVHVADSENHGVARNTEGCGGMTYKNHGQFVKDAVANGMDAATAAKSPCGKPLHEKQGDDEQPATAGSQDTPANPDCQGSPPWAKGALTGQAKADAQAAWQAKCGDSDEDEATEQEAPEAPEVGHQPASPGQSGDDHGQSGDDHGKPSTTLAPAAPANPIGQSGDDQGQAGDDHGQSNEEHGATTTTSTSTSTTSTTALAET
jgi:hypothetical protein